MKMDNCPKCGRDFVDYDHPVTEKVDGYVETRYPYRKSCIIQYLGVREQHMADPVDMGGCGWAWGEDPRAKHLIDRYIETNYKG